MDQLKQKWSLIAFLKPITEGYEFYYKEYPLHISLASVFAIDWDINNNLANLKSLISTLSPINTVAIEEAFWGSEGQFHVMLLDNNHEFNQLHKSINQFLLNSGAVFNEPQFEGSGYIPHSTIQKNARLMPGDEVRITTLTLLDMFPNNDGYQRKIGPTFIIGG